MDKYLVFRLYGPLAAWGEIAVGEVRRSAPYPSRSALLGLLSASIGMRREEQDRLDALSSGCEIALKVLSVGTMLRDYHTVQVPDNVGKQVYYTRRDEVVGGRDRLGTILSTREYRCDALVIVAVRVRLGASISVEDLRNHLLSPSFVPYLGRKSCPLAAPMHPQVVESGGFREALDKTVFPPLVTMWDGVTDATGRFIDMHQTRYYWEGEAGDMSPQQTAERYDQPVNRRRWQFAPRREHMMITEGCK
jgi:CRISPR system Cascade subunit CasD